MTRAKTLHLSGLYQELWVMKQFVGAVSATLIVASSVAQAAPLARSGTTGSPLYHAVSDIDGPYYSDAPPPPPAPIPAPAPRYGYGPGPDYGYRPQPGYVPEREYRPEPYDPDYGYAPAFLPMHEVYAIVRHNGFSPLGAPRQRGITYVIAVLDRDGEDGRLVIDARSGRILRFVPAFQWGEQYERMRFEPGRDQPAPGAPRLASRAMPPVPKLAAPATRPATQTAAVQPKPEARSVEMKPAEAKPAQQTAASVAQPQPNAAANPPQAPAQQKPAPQILPTEAMPPAQGLE
jgi:hypothetical protein